MGGCAKNGDKVDKGKDGKDGTNNAGTGILGLVAPGGAGFDISDEKRVFMVQFSGATKTGPPEDSLLKAHLAHLEKLTASGVLDSAAAAVAGDSGVQILIAANPEEAATIAGSDPLLREGYYTRIQITEMVLP